MTKQKKTFPRMEIIKALLKDLRWLQSKENAVRMDDKRIQGHGIIVDAMLICFDFAQKLGMDRKQITNELVLRVAMENCGEEREHFMKLWKESEKMLGKDRE